MRTDNFRLLCKDLRHMVRDQDVVGSLNIEHGLFSGFLVTDPYARDKLEDWAKTLLGDSEAHVTLRVTEGCGGEIEVAWPKGLEYLLFE